jgi:outer membrane protein assembly factor BamB
MAKDAPEGARHVGPAPVLFVGGVIARHDGSKVTALDPSLAKTLWTFDAKAGAASFFAGLLVGDLYVIATGPEVIALRVADGVVAWRYAPPGGDEVSMAPASANGRVFFGTKTGIATALTLATGEVAWTTSTKAEFGWSDPVVAFEKVWMADRGRRDEEQRPGAVNAFDVATGRLVSSEVFGATGCSAPGVAGDAVFAGFGRRVAFFDAVNGRRRDTPSIRTGANAFGSPTLVGNTVYFGNLDGNFYAHDATTGALKWRFALPGAQVGPFVVDGDRLIGSSSAGLFALGDDPGADVAPPGFVLEGPAKVAMVVERERADRPSTPVVGPVVDAKSLVADVRQLTDAARRECALATMASSLAPADTPAARAALLAIAELRDVRYDKDAMRVLVRPYLAAASPEVRRMAAYALANASPVKEDQALFLGLAKDADPSVRSSAAHLLMMTNEGRVEGAAAEAVLVLLSEKGDVVRETMRGLWGARVSEAVEARLVALAGDASLRHDAIYFALSTFPEKSDAVIGVLVAALADREDFERATWGLGYGVAKERAPKVVEAALALIETREGAYVVEPALGLVRKYATAADRTAVERVAANPKVDAATREALTKLAGERR